MEVLGCLVVDDSDESDTIRWDSDEDDVELYKYWQLRVYDYHHVRQ